PDSCRLWRARRSAGLGSYPRRRQRLGHFFFSSRRRHTRSKRDWSSDVCSSDLHELQSGWRMNLIQSSCLRWKRYLSSCTQKLEKRWLLITVLQKIQQRAMESEFLM